MAINFPSSPSLNDTYTDGNGVVWKYDGTRWVATPEVDDIPVNAADDVPISSNWAYDHENSSDPHQPKATVLNDTHDLDVDADTVGWYVWLGTAPSNAPRASYGAMHTINDSAQPIQIVYDYTTADIMGMFIRRKSSGTWDSWSEVIMDNSVEDTPSNAVTDKPISSNWAYDHENGSDPHSGEYVTKDADTGAADLPSGTTAQRPTPATGMIRFNSTNGAFEGYDGSTWGSMGGAAGASGDAIFYENDTEVSANYTITSGKNAMSAGPITIADGVTVTVPTGSVWTVV